MKRTSVFLILIYLSPIIAGRDHSYFEMSFDKENRIIHFRDFVNGDRDQIIRHPSEYINCDIKIKRYIRGTLKISDTEVAKNFPILDQTTFKVWYTNQKGNFDIEFPGNCELSIGTFNKKGMGTSFLFIKATENNFNQDIILPSKAYLMSIAEYIPDDFIESKLLGQFKSDHSWPPPKVPMICVNGFLPEKNVDFHPFVVNLETQEYFSGFDYNDRFEVKFPKTTKYIFIAYANKPPGSLNIFLADPNPDHSKLADKHNGCIQIAIKLHKNVKYNELSQFNLLDLK